VFTFSSVEEVDAAVITRQPLWNNRRSDHGPFDIIGDVHGCFDELCELLTTLGYTSGENGAFVPPTGRKAVFVGDLVDRGPKIPETMRLVMDMAAAGHALCVPGNHDIKFMRAVFGKKVQVNHGLADSLEQFAAYEAHYPGFTRVAAEWIDKLVSHYVLDDGKLVVAHAGMKESMQGRGSGAVREFAMYGETTGETDEFGLPVRYNWAAEYRGRATVVYGHTPIPQPEWLNRTINLDTGCVFGGALTALRYPEMGFVTVAARATYCQPAKPFLPPETSAPTLTAQQTNDDVLDLEDVMGKRIIATRLRGNVTVREENATAALEVMSRFAVDPKWLIYLPPTMSPCETSQAEGLLEHPVEAFAYYRDRGVPRVVCQEKHMGSRAVVVGCQSPEAARRRFGVETDRAAAGAGMIYTRTGRRFFGDAQADQEAGLLTRLSTAATAAGLWEELGTDWVCLDCELMPWSAKAQSLLETQYAPVGSAATAGLAATVGTLEQTAANGTDVAELLSAARERLDAAGRYVAAYRAYCWPVHGVDDLKLAAFHLLASDGKTYFGKDHTWHMEILGRLSAHDPMLLATTNRLVQLTDAESVQAATVWWEELTARGGEGMVVKPLEFIAKGTKRGDLLQPAIKCRGREYLRIIYGPEYDRPENLSRLRSRGLSGKRSLALREFALGMEGLERFATRREPLRRVHECVFGVLALESEPVDPRL
jgi:protein phosphatase